MGINIILLLITVLHFYTFPVTENMSLFLYNKKFTEDWFSIRLIRLLKKRKMKNIKRICEQSFRIFLCNFKWSKISFNKRRNNKNIYHTLTAVITAFIKFLKIFLNKCKKIYKKVLTKNLNNDILHLLATKYIEC